MMDNVLKKLLIKRRGIAKATLTRIKNYVDKFDAGLGLNLISSRLEQLTKLWHEFMEPQNELELNDELEDHSADREAFEEDYHATNAKMNSLLQPAVPPPTVVPSAELVGTPLCCGHRPTTVGLSNVQLPMIKLPTFGGDYNQWIHFRDVFVSLVVNNKELPYVQKFHYLLSCLSGEAHDLVKSLPVCDANFEIAWGMLIARYHNDRLIASRHVKELLNLPTVYRESASDLRALLNQVKSNMDAIEALKLQTPLHEILLSQLILDRLDISSRKHWESTYNSTEIPNLDMLSSFLEQRCQALEIINIGYKNKPNDTINVHKERKQERVSYVTSGTKSQTCLYCRGTSHHIHSCSQFLQLGVQQRINFVNEHTLCYNCLRDGHPTSACQSTSCRVCSARHHSLLHQEGQMRMEYTQMRSPTQFQQSTSNNNLQNNNEQHVTNNYCSIKAQPNVQVLLSTVIVRVRDSNGQLHFCRALLDSASQSHFVSDSLVQRLNLNKQHNQFPIHGISNSLSETKHCVTLQFQSTVSEYNATICCSVLPQITGNIPATCLNPVTWGIPHDITLADPYFYQPSKVDLLIGAELFFELMLPQQQSRPGNYPIIHNTQLGWILSGRVPLSQEEEVTPRPQHSFFLRCDDNSQQSLQRFKETEDNNHTTWKLMNEKTEQRKQEIIEGGRHEQEGIQRKKEAKNKQKMHQAEKNKIKGLKSASTIAISNAIKKSNAKTNNERKVQPVAQKKKEITKSAECSILGKLYTFLKFLLTLFTSCVLYLVALQVVAGDEYDSLCQVTNVAWDGVVATLPQLLRSLPDPDLSDININRLDRWQLIQRATQQLWRRWSADYLHGLQQRAKWTNPQNNLQPGTVVLLKEETSPLHWKTAVVIDTHPGPDGLVRVVTIKSASGTYRRPIHKLCPFPE